VQEHNAQVPPVEFFNAPRMTQLREAYAAGRFALIRTQHGEAWEEEPTMRLHSSRRTLVALALVLLTVVMAGGEEQFGKRTIGWYYQQRSQEFQSGVLFGTFEALAFVGLRCKEQPVTMSTVLAGGLVLAEAKRRISGWEQAPMVGSMLVVLSGDDGCYLDPARLEELKVASSLLKRVPR
jgi:hypothetical protein